MSRATELESALDGHAAQTAAEQTSLSRIRALLRSAPDPFTRDQPDHVTASAVVSRPDGSAFLLVDHRRLERWLQPGGHVEPEDASVFDAARREAVEETGIGELEAPFGDRILDVDVHPVPARGRKPAHVHYDVRFLFTTEAVSLVPRPDEVRGARWFAVAEALAPGNEESLTRALRKARNLLCPGGARG